MVVFKHICLPFNLFKLALRPKHKKNTGPQSSFGPNYVWFMKTLTQFWTSPKLDLGPGPDQNAHPTSLCSLSSPSQISKGGALQISFILAMSYILIFLCFKTKLTV